MSKVVIIGGGAAGMFAAISAAECGHDVTLYEKNEKLGKKVYITGKGRCNLTNACDMDTLFDSICSNRKFLFSALYGFSNQDVIAFFEQNGMKTKTERGNRVFPASDHASDVTQTLAVRMRSLGVRVCLNTAVEKLLYQEAEETFPLRMVCGVCLANGTKVPADAVIVATGGLSYPTTGSTGDGHRFAREAGLEVTECSPSLVPLCVAEQDAIEMQGLSLKNVEATIQDGKKVLYRDFGEMMFTHFGVTGPLILTASTCIQKQLKKHPLDLFIDLKPALSEEQLDTRLLREFEQNKNKQFKNILGSLFPSKMIPVMIRRSGIPEDKPANEISRAERLHLIQVTKQFSLTVIALRGYNEAIITRGGVSVKEINPATMESKKIKGLHFAGEVLDVDAVTGGFNLQIAWSTGYAAGRGITEGE